MKSQKKHKECLGCGDSFITFKNYDYCANCAINNNRYLRPSNCSECDGSGMIKFRQQKPRPCKLCALTKKTMNKTKKLTPEQAEQQFWTEVDEKSKWEVYKILSANIPLQNVKPILENWRYEDKQTKLVGLFLEKDVDFRTVGADLESQYSYEEELPSPNYLGKEIAYWYLISVIKGLIRSLSAYDCYDPAHFENLTTYDY